VISAQASTVSTSPCGTDKSLALTVHWEAQLRTTGQCSAHPTSRFQSYSIKTSRTTVIIAPSDDLVNLYSGHTLIRTTLFISHGPFISLYNIQESKWIKHVKFEEGNIISLIKKHRVTPHGRDSEDIAVLLENGSLFVNIGSKLFENEEEKITINASMRTE
jgi:hypothetical protein